VARKALTLEEQHKRQAKERLEAIRVEKRKQEQEKLDKRRRERIKSIQIEQSLILAEKRLKAVKKKKGLASLLGKKKKRSSSSW